MRAFPQLPLLCMPLPLPRAMRLQGRMQGPDVGDLLAVLALEDADVADRSSYVPVGARIEELRKWVAAQPAPQA